MRDTIKLQCLKTSIAQDQLKEDSGFRKRFIALLKEGAISCENVFI